jgi:DNA helicase-2/ATP-dependent DNA helicase PcrA
MEKPADIKSTGWNLRDQQISRVYEGYLKTLANAGALDFDDLLLKTVELFETVERVRTFYAHKFRFVLVDEYQDTNRPQYMLIRRLAQVHRNLCVVGDPDQSSTMARRGPAQHSRFRADFPDVSIVKLEQNYRSTQVILDAASAVISRNRNRKDKRLWTEQQGGARIVYYRAGDESKRPISITRGIKEDRASAAGAMTAVLYRTNAQSRAIEDA